MARLKIPDVLSSSEKPDGTNTQTVTTGDINQNEANCSRHHEKEDPPVSTDPVILSPTQYIELFGNSSEDDNDSNSFHGFDDDSESLKELTPKSEDTTSSESSPENKMVRVSEQTNARRHFTRQLSPTDESNPYRKKYLSYTRDRSKPRKPVFPSHQQVNCMKSPQDKENKLSLSNPQQHQGIKQTAQNIVNKAYKVKHRKTIISPLKVVSTKYGRVCGRSRRKQKLNYNSDFIYDPPVKKQRCEKESKSYINKDKSHTNRDDKSHINKEIKQDSNGNGRYSGSSEDVTDYIKEEEMISEEKPSICKEGKDNITACAVKQEDVCETDLPVHVKQETDVGADGLAKVVKKKKARIKYASDINSLPIFKKKVKMKNLSLNRPCVEGTSPYERATFSHPSSTNITDPLLTHIKQEPDLLNTSQLQSRGENFTDIFLNYSGKINNVTSTSSLNSNTSHPANTSFGFGTDAYTGLLLEDQEGNYKSLEVERHLVKTEDIDDDTFQSSKKTLRSKNKHNDSKIFKPNNRTFRSGNKLKRIKGKNQPRVVLTDYLSDTKLDGKENKEASPQKYDNKNNNKNNRTHRTEHFPNTSLLDVGKNKNNDSKNESSISKYPRRDSVIERHKLSYVEGLLQFDDETNMDIFEDIDDFEMMFKESIIKEELKIKRGRGRPRKDISMAVSQGNINTVECFSSQRNKSFYAEEILKKRVALHKKEPLQPSKKPLQLSKKPLQPSKKPLELKNNILTKEKSPKEADQIISTKKIKNVLQLKAIKKNGEIHLVNFQNEIIEFCGTCANCVKKIDCGMCKHCKNHKFHVTRLLPCWQRRCLNPIIGEKVDITHSKARACVEEKSETTLGTDVLQQPSEVATPGCVEQESSPVKTLNIDEVKKEKEDKAKTEKSLEKLEVCLVSDNPIISSTKGDGVQLEFHVQRSAHKKSRKKSLNNSDIDVFTGMSPIKPKLRSTMNDLITRTDPMDTILPRVEFGPETLVKLPWPKDTKEDAAWVSGYHLCLTSPIDLDLWNLCFLCGSAGKDKMLICNFCCEAFHSYCLDVDPIDYKNWCCDRCKRCIVCGFKENLLMCDICHDCYHADCLGPFYQRDTEGDEETWVCGKCVKCTKCGQRRAGKVKTSKWMFDFTMCEDCGTNWKKGNYCPICEKIYNDTDDHLKMMCCSECDQWIHRECEGISIDDYEILADLPETILYICKLCTVESNIESTWFKEVQEELNGGFLKIYYDVTSHKDLKSVKRQLGEVHSIANSLEVFDVVFRSIEECKFSCVNEFHIFMIQAIKQVSLSIKEIAVADLPLSFYPSIDSLEIYFEKALKNLFPWFSPDSLLPAEKKPPDPQKVFDQCTVALNGQETSLLHDHKYVAKLIKSNGDKSSRDEDEEWAFNILLEDGDKPKSKKSMDVRRCIFCNQFGDGESCGTGRLLYAGVNEWVHINCALWSAEVYEDEDGRLKHVHDALKRGNKLKCDCCDQLGATIGCCSLKCPKSYHFYCAKKSGVVFLDDKKIYCSGHASKANKNLILASEELSVPRRVVVDLTRFKSLKRVQRGLDPRSINVYSGGFSLHSLGTLSEYSDVKQALIPIGYRVTRIFWSSKRPTHRCKYTCEIQVLRNQVKPETEESTDSPEVVGETLTYCHDTKEWQKIKEKSVCSCICASNRKSKKRGAKRKIHLTGPCEKCLRNQKYVFEKHSDFIMKCK